jgi:hypothetical protein
VGRRRSAGRTTASRPSRPSRSSSQPTGDARRNLDSPGAWTPRPRRWISVTSREEAVWRDREVRGHRPLRAPEQGEGR